MEKVIRLANDPIFHNSVRYDDNKSYKGEAIMPQSSASDSVRDRADGVRDAIFELQLTGKLDPTDLQIIAARDCSPMPSNREVARQIGVTHTEVNQRVSKVKRLTQTACGE